MARNALGRGLGALIREPEPAAPQLRAASITSSTPGAQPPSHRRRLPPAGRCKSIST